MERSSGVWVSQALWPKQKGPFLTVDSFVNLTTSISTIAMSVSLLINAGLDHPHL